MAKFESPGCTTIFRRLLIRILYRIRTHLERYIEPEEEGFLKKGQGIKGVHRKFGFSKRHPIPVNWPEGEYEYLSRLRCPCGEPFFFQRVGSCGFAPDGHVVDRFELMCRKKEHRYFLYLDMYHSGMPSTSPKGLSLSTPAGVGTTVGVENFEKMTFEEMEERVMGCKE